MEPGAALPPGVSLAPLAPGQPWFAEAVALYCATWPEDGSDAEIGDFMTRYARVVGYRGLVAIRVGRDGDNGGEGDNGDSGRLAAFGFGARSGPGNWWHDQVIAVAGADHPALQDAWALVDLAVAPAERGRGIGAALVTALLAAQPCPRALLSTEVDNATARRLYERLGWTVLIPRMTFGREDGALFTVMAREMAA